MSHKGPRARLVRDAIHGDIRVSALEAAVIDTRVFQRLRYIRQNGLLHFVFPGAVHTRFAHSIGTMAVAGRVWTRFSDLMALKPTDRSVQYVESIFRLAALLHDVGHCAFSHASEKVSVNGEPLFGTLRTRLNHWQQSSLVTALEKVQPESLDESAMHEELGLALVSFLFDKPAVREICAATLKVDARTLASDVQAMMNGGLPVSSTWVRHSEKLWTYYNEAYLRGRVFGKVYKNDFSEGLRSILHSLVSGTLDVDRMDYLLRDSYYCGVPYGRYDADILIGNLAVGGVGGKLELFLSRKAVDALDDLLWSRYQLFVQVLNHKANVALNTALGLAISDAIDDAILDQPKTLESYLLFTDDYVMATVRNACSRGKLEHKKYAKTLVDRRLPLHLGATELGPNPSTARVKRALMLKAKAAGVKPGQVFSGDAESILFKPGLFPSILNWNRAKNRYDLHAFDEYSQFKSQKLPVRRNIRHYYVDR
jgi:HD superfamily phosphohydrolase